MNKDLTDITLVIDRSGSMAKIKDDAEGGINTLISDQAKVEGKALLTIAQFDCKYEVVCNGANVGDIGTYWLAPRGMTALLDAVGRTINMVGERLSKMDESDRPGLVIIAIVTDGQENASREFTSTQIAEMIKHQKDVYGWKFLFLCTDEAVLTEAVSWGVEQASSSVYNAENSRQAYTKTGDVITRHRNASAKGLSGDNVGFTNKDRADMGTC